MIWVIGAGAFGTALAVSLAAKGPVTLWARDPAHAAETARRRENLRRLPGVPLPPSLAVTADFADLEQGPPCLLAVPAQKLRHLLEGHGSALSGRPLVACCKGVELTTGRTPTQILGELVPDAPNAILTGPGFAHEIAQRLPTALTLACADDAMGAALQQALSTPSLRLYRTTDVIGAEQGGALKNVMAIACGAAIGAGLGESARAALMTRGFAEMTRMAVALGARAETLSGLSGLGDLALTCMSHQSRNYRFGLSLGRGETFDRAVTVEGAATARAVTARAGGLNVDMPVTRAIVAVTDGELRVVDALDMLLARPLKEE